MGYGDKERRDYSGGIYLSRYEFEQAMLRVDGRLNAQDGELAKIRERLHTIANTVAEIQLVKLEVENISKKLDTFLDDRKGGMKMWQGALIAFVFAVLMLAMQIVAKKLGLL